MITNYAVVQQLQQTTPKLCAETGCPYLMRWAKWCPLHAKEHAKAAPPQPLSRQKVPGVEDHHNGA
jgi:hypothetical protein